MTQLGSFHQTVSVDGLQFQYEKKSDWKASDTTNFSNFTDNTKCKHR